MTHAYICDALRTPFGRYGGALASVRLSAGGTSAIPAGTHSAQGLEEYPFRELALVTAIGVHDPEPQRAGGFEALPSEQELVA